MLKKNTTRSLFIIEELDGWKQPFFDYFKENKLLSNKSLDTNQKEDHTICIR